ncbi:hypothetical protein, partial [Nitrobacter sp.]|uniref:hypothetical protein n=1 Tax=Nitrobacter sp. TaxID=29420 RepID=UPI0032204812
EGSGFKRLAPALPAGGCVAPVAGSDTLETGGAGAGDVACKPGLVVDDISDVDGPEGDRGAVMAGVVCGCPCA